MENFLGKDGFVWFIGVIENRADPLGMGRCQIRIFGWHTSNKIDLANYGEDKKYNYSLVNYKTGKDKVIIICRFHGEFLQTPQYHKNGRKCPKCVREKTRLTSKEVISKFKKIHGDVYDYSQVNFLSSKDKVTIVCNEHGSFLQTPPAHLRGQGCAKCQTKKISKSSKVVIQVGVASISRISVYCIGCVVKITST